MRFASPLLAVGARFRHSLLCTLDLRMRRALATIQFHTFSVAHGAKINGQNEQLCYATGDAPQTAVLRDWRRSTGDPSYDHIYKWDHFG